MNEIEWNNIISGNILTGSSSRENDYHVHEPLSIQH